MTDPTAVAVHIEVVDGDVDKAKAAARKLAKELGAQTARVSTHEGSWDVLKDDAVDAETIDGKKVRVKNPDAFDAFPKKIERVAPDPTPEQIRELRGEKAPKKGAAA